MSNSNVKGMKRLFLDAVHSAAIEDTDELDRKDPLIDDERLRQAIRGENPLSPEEQRLVVLSIETQERIAILNRIEQIKAQDLVAEQEDTQSYWAGRGWDDTELILLAAADAERTVKPIHIEKPLYSVDLLPIDADGRVWRINLRIAQQEIDDLLEHTPRGVRLIDNEGEIWAEGPLSETGELVGFWERDDDLLARLHRCSLKLKPL